jgi:hypothetical protein
MMEAADHGCLDDPAVVKALHPSWLRGVLRQGEVGAGPVVVDEVLAQQATQMGFVQHHDVVEALRMRVIMPAIIDQAGRKSTLTRWTE